MCCFFDETSGYVFLILYCKKGIFSFSPFLDIIVLVFDFFFLCWCLCCFGVEQCTCEDLVL